VLVMIVEKVPAYLRSKLSAWFSEPREGVFIGNTNERVRDELWEKMTRASEPAGGVVQIWFDPVTGGFNYRQCGARNCGRFEAGPGVLLGSSTVSEELSAVLTV
jgi:CRISPR-associated endoribonuclease Cas2 subtype I-E